MATAEAHIIPHQQSCSLWALHACAHFCSPEQRLHSAFYRTSARSPQNLGTWQDRLCGDIQQLVCGLAIGAVHIGAPRPDGGLIDISHGYK